jgi:hypothetical protein
MQQRSADFKNRLTITASKVGENTPAAAVCCGVCRTCVQTNIVAAAFAAVVAAGATVAGLFRRRRARA